MAAKYQPLTDHLRAASARRQEVVDLDFDQVAAIVGGLPASAYQHRAWWANGSLVQALAWGAAGFHVAQVSLDQRRVRFKAGSRGLTAGRNSRAAQVAPFAQPLESPPVDVRVVLQWVRAGRVTLDDSGELTFGVIPPAPGLYRFLLWQGTGPAPHHVYIGEAENLRRRLYGGYRNPGPSQTTNLRISGLLRQHMLSGGAVELGLVTGARAWISGDQRVLDLRSRAARVMAEQAVLVVLAGADGVSLLNARD